MNKFKLFIDNFLVYGLGGIINKIVPFLMVPIVTRLIPDAKYYGISDLSNTVVQFGSAIAVMGMYDAMYRMFFESEDDEYKKNLCSTALGFTLFTSIVVFIIMMLCRNWIADLFFSNKQYAYVAYISAIATLVGATNSIISAPTRMQNKRKVFLITNTVSPLLSYAIALPMLLAGHYVIALPLSAVVAGVSIEILFGFMNRDWFDFKRFDFELLKQLLVIAVPLFPNFIIYWVFNSCDKVMITNMIGVDAAGIYSVGSKLGHASQLIYTAFAGGWQYFSFSTMKEGNQVKSNSMIFEYLGIISFIASAFVCAWSSWVFKFLFIGVYVDGYIIAPYLFLAPLLQMLFQVASNQFLVIKKTWPNMMILSSGAIINILLNLTLIPILGIEGASIATLTGYIISDMICALVLCKMHLMFVSRRFIVCVIIMVIYFVTWRLFVINKTLIGTVMAIIMTIMFGQLYKRDLSKLSSMVKKRG